jgi:hypothetical protein
MANNGEKRKKEFLYNVNDVKQNVDKLSISYSFS